MVDDITKEFLASIEEVSKTLNELNFKFDTKIDKCPAFWIQFKHHKSKVIVKYCFGPPQYELVFSMIIHGKIYEFKDLLQIEYISDWVKKNRYIPNKQRSIYQEMMWDVELIKVVLQFFKIQL